MKRAAWLLVFAACRPAAAPPPPAKPAAVLSKEADLVVVTLTEEAERRLGLKTARIERRKVERTRELGGEAVVPAGASVVVSAPIAGTLGGEPPRAGSAVRKGAAFLVLTPFLSPEARASLAASRVEAEASAASARVRVEAARVELDRAEKLLRDGAGSRRAADEAGARLRSAEADLKGAEAKREFLKEAVDGTLGPISVAAPFDGILLKIHAAPGQAVPAGTPLFELANLERLWVRVPVFVGDLPGIDLERGISIEGRAAKPTSAPPAADPTRSTADLVYEVENVPPVFRPGQKLSVPVPLRATEEAATLPAAAVLYDIHGGAWVYERVAPLKYARRRVRVRRVDGSTAVLDGAPRGEAFVVEGAAELFGTEFYVNK